MADVTGAVHYEFGGKHYVLRLTLGGIGKLQGKHGNDLGGLLSGKVEGIPPFAIMVDMVAASLEKGQRMDPEMAADLADDMLTADQTLIERVLKAAFPDAKPGNANAPKAKG